MRLLRWVPFCALLGCAGGNAASQLVRPPEFQPANQTKCAVRKSASHPLVVEWPSADRATLEAKARSGLVAVRYVGCEMEVLDRCKVTGKYGYTAITPKQERVTIHDADELYASLPVGAARLEGTLAQSGQLDVDMTIVGQWDADHTDVGSADLQGDECARATHVVSAMTVGAFEFYSGGDANVGAQAGAFGVGARGKSAASRELLERDGSPKECEAAHGDETAPPEDCGAVLRVEVTPIHPSPPAAAPAPAPAPAPAESATTTATNPPPTVTMVGGLTSSTMFRSSNDGNLDVTVRCASPDVLTPYAGLSVYVDGASAPIAAKRVHLAGPQDLTQAAPTGPVVPMGMPSDVAYALDPGHHMLRVTAPGCAALETAVDVSDAHATTVDGYLPPDTAWGKGTSGTPLGGSFAIGAYAAPFPHVSVDSNTTSNPTTATVDSSSGPYGGWFGIGGTSRWWLGMLDMGIGFGSIQGHVTEGGTPGSQFTGSTMHMGMDLRFGGRLPLRWAALSAGSGIGGAFYIVTSTHLADQSSTADLPDLGAPVWFVPLWAGLDVKPWCDWGVSTGASYDWAPTQPGWSSMTFWLGVLDQPSGGACGHDGSLQVH